MFANSIIAATGALLTLVAAVPMADQHPHHHHHHHPAHKRDYVWVTLTEVAIETIPVTKTVWIEPGETPPTQNNTPEPYGPPAQTSSSSSPVAPAYTPPASSSSSSAPPPPPAYTPPAPTTSTSTYVAPAYTPPPPSTPATYAAPSSAPAPAPAPAAPASSPASNGGSTTGVQGMAAAGTYYTGDLTWYDVGLGACGITNTKDEAIVAIPEKIFDAYTPGNPNKNPLCGKSVSITGKDGSTYKATIVDRCPGCTENDLDLSEDFFNKVTQHGDGRVHGMKWCFD
ncbi:hypothetical protein AC578_7201 [Pseudocercospora eumusae]|uniref:RlpA-like protein double-psi beta-barrel domain-containing protein n=1 Tax=Pseudocercospora eumusae TaxID=321146 RepID=A0A139HX55_9PEZI|nr:hypothetical protein AC578_7201 [Pseudocercospora eumusae]